MIHGNYTCRDMLLRVESLQRCLSEQPDPSEALNELRQLSHTPHSFECALAAVAACTCGVAEAQVVLQHYNAQHI